jgi:hypothetical protein
VNSSMIEGRRADSARRRQRVVQAISGATRSGEPISVSAIARRAGVDRSFLYRHKDLLAQVHAAELVPSDGQGGTSPVTRASLQADLANAQERNNRLTSRVRQLEARLAETLGNEVWRETGVGSATDIDELHRKLTRLEQANIELTATLDERIAELEAARAANRELTRSLNHARASPR